LLKSGYKDKARSLFIKALQRHPTYQSFVFGLADYYIQASETQKAINLLNAYTLRFYKNPYLYELLAKAYSMQGKKLLQYENLAESFYFKYNLQEAILQMNFAVSASDGNFYEKSRVEARLKQLQREREFYSGNQ
jgi:predicted Zn-dependent protease